MRLPSLPTKKCGILNIKHGTNRSSLFMREQFGENFGNSGSPNVENARFDVHSIHKGIPEGLPEDMVEAPGPRIGPDFLDVKSEKEKSKEKLEEIKKVILETEIDLLSPANSYRLLAKELEGRGLFKDELKHDVNLFFNQKLVYLYNKENLKGKHAETTEEALKKNTEAAFAGAKSMHDTIENLEKIEESGGNDAQIQEYWDAKKTFHLDLIEKDTEHLYKKEKMLLENLLNAQKYGALAEKAVRDLIKKSSLYIKEMIEKDETLKNSYPDGLIIKVTEASIKDDVYSAIDFYVEVVLDGESIYFPVQVKCGNIDVKHGEDKETQDYIMKNLVRLVGDEDRFRCNKNSCYYEKKTTIKLNKFVEKALANNGYEKGLYTILPRGKEMLKENGDVDEEVEKKFMEQFTKKISDLIYN